MAEILNLRAAKKAKVRAAARRQGDENAAKFGRSKAEQRAETTRTAKAARDLDAHKRDAP
jgi:hypothetical protein